MRELWKRIGVIITAIILLVGCVAGFVFYLYGLSGPWAFSEEFIVVKTDTLERRGVVSVADVLKEKGKETVYFITIEDAEWNDVLEFELELTESEYNKYIGSGNNCITYKYGYCKAEAKDFMDWKSNGYTAERWSFPWDEKTVEFTDEEIGSLKKLIVSENGRISTTGDLPFLTNDFTKEW